MVGTKMRLPGRVRHFLDAPRPPDSIGRFGPNAYTKRSSHLFIQANRDLRQASVLWGIIVGPLVRRGCIDLLPR